MRDDSRSLARQPRRVEATADDVIEAFDACSEGQGWGPEDCQVLSPDGRHRCYDDAPWRGTGHEVYHWCGCDEQWPLVPHDDTVYAALDDVSVTVFGDFTTIQFGPGTYLAPKTSER